MLTSPSTVRDTHRGWPLAPGPAVCEGPGEDEGKGSRVKRAPFVVVAVATVVALGGTASGAATGEPLLPDPGPDGLVWVPEMTGDGGFVSAGASDRLPTVLTVACEGGGSVAVSMTQLEAEVAAFTVECPVESAGIGSQEMAPGVVVFGSFSVGIDASSDAIRWSATLVQPEQPG